MKSFEVSPSQLRGTVVVPASKSQTMRALLFAAMAGGSSLIHSPLDGSDTDAMMKVLRKFGASLEWEGHESISVKGINGKVGKVLGALDVGNSGLALRFCTALAALGTDSVHITGDHSICNQRPMQSLLDALGQLKVDIRSFRKQGYAPIEVRGPMHPGACRLLGQDSQPVSALIIAAAFAEGAIEIAVDEPGEKPWVDLTLHWLSRLEIPFERKEHSWYRLQGSNRYPGFNYTVPGDLSSAAFPVAAAVMTGSEVLIENVDFNDPQGDKEFLLLLRKMGADIEVCPESHTLYVRGGRRLTGTKVDLNGFIDALPILAVVGTCAEGETLIQNASIARTKECNRISCIVSELKKMGAAIEETEDGVRVTPSKLKGSEVLAHGDHRMALALSVAALSAKGRTLIKGVDCITKTYPTFCKDFQEIGAAIGEV